MSFQSGDWVENAKYGIGQIDAVRPSEKYEVRFLGAPSEKRAIMGSFLKAAAPPHPSFKFPTSLTRSTPGAAKRSQNAKSAIPFTQLFAAFMRIFPEGFEDPRFQVRERAEKIGGVAALKERLGKEQLHSMIVADDWEAFRDAASYVVQSTNLIFRIEKTILRDGLQQPENALAIARSLFGILYSELSEEAAFEDFVSSLSNIQAAKWTIATYFQFLATSGEKMFMKPSVMQAMADSVGIPLEYRTFPNYRSYSKLQQVSSKVAELLKENGLQPRSGLDVQGFIWSSIQIEDGKYEV